MLGSIRETSIELLSLLCSLIALGFAIVVIIDAFNEGILEGILCLLCGLYLLYYAIFKFDNEKKWLIVAAFLVFSIAGGVTRFV